MTSVATKRSGVSPTRNSHQNRPKALRAPTMAEVIGPPAPRSTPPTAPGRDRPGRLFADRLGRVVSGSSVRIQTTAIAVTPANTAINTRMARSLPGQWTPAPSPTQNRPKLVSMIPTTVLMVFSGTAASWRATISPTTATMTRGRRRGQRGEPETMLAGTEADHDEDDFGPLEEDALEGHGEADPVTTAGAGPGRFRDGDRPCRGRRRSAVPSGRRRSAVVSAKMASSSCLALCPLARRMALRSQDRPRTRSSAPTTTRRASSGT